MQVLKEDIRKRILEEARKEFVRKGYAKASVRIIAQDAGVGVGNLYNYFSGKDELFRHVVAPVVRAFYVMLELHLDKRRPACDMLGEEYLSHAAVEYMKLLNGNRTLLKLLLFGAQGSSLEHFKMEFTGDATGKVMDWFRQNLSPRAAMDEQVSGFLIHLHTVSMFSMIEEIVMHRIPDDKQLEIVRKYIQLEIFGWQHCLKLEE